MKTTKPQETGKNPPKKAKKDSPKTNEPRFIVVSQNPRIISPESESEDDVVVQSPQQKRTEQEKAKRERERTEREKTEREKTEREKTEQEKTEREKAEQEQEQERTEREKTEQEQEKEEKETEKGEKNTVAVEEWPAEDEQNLVKYVREVKSVWGKVSMRFGNRYSSTACRSKYSRLRQQAREWEKKKAAPPPEEGTKKRGRKPKPIDERQQHLFEEILAYEKKNLEAGKMYVLKPDTPTEEHFQEVEKEETKKTKRVREKIESHQTKAEAHAQSMQLIAENSTANRKSMEVMNTSLSTLVGAYQNYTNQKANFFREKLEILRKKE